MRLMVIDDQKDMIDVATMMVELCGHEVIASYLLPDQAKRHEDWASIDLVLTDLRLPSEEEGVRWLAWLHLSKPQIPVIVMTASDPSTVLFGFPEVGGLCETVLFKPFSPEDLCHAITGAVDG